MLLALNEPLIILDSLKRERKKKKIAFDPFHGCGFRSVKINFLNARGEKGGRKQTESTKLYLNSKQSYSMTER